MGVFYYWWENPSHDPWLSYGDWRGLNLTPQEGYYESTYAYIRGDIAQMKSANIDFAIVPFSWFGFERYKALAQAAKEKDFLFAPLLDLSELEYYPDYRAVAPPSESFSHPFLFDTQFFFPSFLGKEGQADSLLYWNQQQEILSHHAPALWTVTPSYKDDSGEIPLKSGNEYSYDLLWQTALSYNPDLVLIASWNQYQQSSAIEPTV